jgi:UDP-N-acetylmuramoyl-tripeptide--D-alanyl-D-alanine ligase
VTGSAGKTTTKEFIAAGLRPLGKVLKTTGNRNTEYTSPLLWGDLEADTQVVVVEMAMRGFGQIAHLAAFSRPSIGVVTNIGYGHLEQVESRDGIARAKGELIEALPQNGVAILWAEDDYLNRLRGIAGRRLVKTFGFSEEADCRVVEYHAEGAISRVRGLCDGQPWSATLPVIGRHIATNAAAAVLTCYLCGVEPDQAANELATATLPKMRMEVRDFNGGSLLIDTYNASPPAMIAAIEALAEMPVTGRRFAVIGEMKELGDASERLHREVGKALGVIDAVIFYGEPMTKFAREEALRAGLNDALVAESIDDVRNFLRYVGEGDAVLIKGSRALELERALED